MKNLFFAIITLLFLASCTPDEPTKYSLSVLPVESFILPDSLILGTTHTFKLKYKRPSTCHFFEGFYYKKNLNERTVGITSSVLQEGCTPLSNPAVEVDLNFMVNNTGDYIFKFYKGKDAAGVSVFETVTVPVKN